MYRSTHWRPWPTEREKGKNTTKTSEQHEGYSNVILGPNNYIGAPVTSPGELKQTCPEECRPSDHMDWARC